MANSRNMSGRGGAKNNRKRKAVDNAESEWSKSRFLVDGSSPRPFDHPPGFIRSPDNTKRQTTVGVRGNILRLIEEAYPTLLCPGCHHMSTSRGEAAAHLKTHHEGEKIFSCVSPACTHVYSSKAGLCYHIEHTHNVSAVAEKSVPSNKKTHRQALSMPYDKRTLKKSLLSPELEKKLNDQYTLTACPSCGEEFKKKTHVIRHLVESHNGEEPYKCVVAGCDHKKAYATREGLVYHLSRYHDQKK